MLDFDNMGQPGVRPSPLVTKTLLFLAEAGNLSGDPGGPMFRAYDKRTGRWSRRSNCRRKPLARR